MHRTTLAGVLPALAAVAALGAGAQNPPVYDRPILTEAEFLAVLDRDHPAVAASAEELAVARARAVEASTLANPVAGVVREDPSGPVAQTDWTVSWQLPHADRRPRVEARRETAAAAGHRLAQRLRSLRLEMRRVYAGWALATARRDRLATRAERVETLARREAARAERGEASGLEVQRLRLAASDLRSRVALSGADVERARAGVASWYPALPADARPRLPELPPPPPPSPPPPEGAGTDDPTAAHPRVRTADAELAAALLEQRAADRFVASPELSLGWQRQEAGPASVDGPLLGVAWSVPLFDRGRGRRAAAGARVAGARARLERARRQARSGRQAAVAAYRRLAEARADAADALTAGTRMLDGAEAAFRHGETGLTDLLETHRAVRDGELTLLDLHGAALAAHRDLERWTRGDDDLPDDLSLPTSKEPTP